MCNMSDFSQMSDTSLDSVAPNSLDMLHRQN